MNLDRVLFIGGDIARSASVKIRCMDISKRLGCCESYHARCTSDIPSRFRVYVCVKSLLRTEELIKLSRRGLVVWDVLDTVPPKELDCVLLASTYVAARALNTGRYVQVIPHHHCNFTGRANPPTIARQTLWAGHKHWYPDIPEIAHHTYMVNNRGRMGLVRAYRKAGILLNFRARSPQSGLHIQLNSGIKLINSIGFGIPSVSDREPAYAEIGADCTVFADPETRVTAVKELVRSECLYQTLRQRCVARATDYHIETISARYRDFLESL